MTYVIITFFVLLFLNLYSSEISQALFYSSKESSMLEMCNLASSEIGSLDVWNSSTLSNAVSQIENKSDAVLVITDEFGKIAYDSNGSIPAGSKYLLLPEVIQALDGYDVFSCDFLDGSMESHAAVPIYSYGILVGSIYMTESDSELGGLIASLQKTIFITTLVLEIGLIIFALFFSNIFTHRLKKIMVSMRTIREGDYSHSVNMGGNDELTVLGDEFNDLIQRLKTSEQKRNNFVSDASHELKTPLASIKLLSDSILQNTMDVDTIKEFVGDIGNEAERLNRMTQKLLSLSRIESQADSDCEIVYLAPTVERVIRMLSAIAKENNITIHTDLAHDSSILILEDDLYQIIFNLVENGIKYNIPGGSLKITLQRVEDNAHLIVEDTGVGIPEESLSHIFERFYRVDKARSRKSGGSGLGLSIVRNMVERNRGEIRIQSQVGKGTQLMVVFPVFDTEESE